jgi:hypothetical protein
MDYPAALAQDGDGSVTGAEPRLSLLFAEVLLIWHAANYLFPAELTRRGDRPALGQAAARRLLWICFRAAIAAALTVVAAGPGAGLLLGATVLAACIVLPAARWFRVRPGYLAEYEVAANAAFALLLHIVISKWNLRPRWSLSHFQMTEDRLAAYLIAGALLIFVVRGGTLIVRGVLARAGTMPPPEFPHAVTIPAPSALDLERALPVDTVELNHGRLIGNVERLILVLFVANGQYTALAFFFAAKGLIRSKDIERRAWADYLILGSLTSFLLAVVVGLLIQTVFRVTGSMPAAPPQ